MEDKCLQKKFYVFQGRGYPIKSRWNIKYWQFVLGWTNLLIPGQYDYCKEPLFFFFIAFQKFSLSGWNLIISYSKNMTQLFPSNTSWTHLIVFSCDWTSEHHEYLKETISILMSHSYPSALSCLILLLIFLFRHLPLSPPLLHFNCRLCLFPINYPVEHPHRSSHTHHLMANSLTNIPLTSSQMTRH